MNNLEYIRSLEVEKLVEFITDCTYACYLKGYFCDDPPQLPAIWERHSEAWERLLH